MKLVVIDEQEVRAFAQTHPEVLALVITPAAEAAHSADHLVAEGLSIALFLGFVKSLAEVAEHLNSIAKLIANAHGLFTWAQAALTGKKPAKPPPLAERLLVVLFDAYANRRAGVAAERLAFTTGADAEAVSKALQDLADRSVVRRARDGTWRYKAA